MKRWSIHLGVVSSRALTFAATLVVAAGCTPIGHITSLLQSGAINPAGSKTALALTSSSLSLTEGSTALIGFALEKPLLTPVMIDVSLVKLGGSALPRFAAFAPTITIPAGQQVGSVTLFSINDAIYEGPEDFELKFQSSQLDTSGAILHFTLHDDEAIPAVSFSLSTQSINKSSASPAILSAALSGASANPITISLAFSGSAVLGTHATSSSSSLTFPPQALSATTSVAAINDSVIEADRTVVVDLTAGSNVVLGTTSRETITIVNDLINPFSINGVKSTTVTSPGTVLVGTHLPTFSWTAASNASSYDVTVLNASGLSTVCATQNTTTLVFTPSSCNLNAGDNYTLSVIARAGTGTRAAANNNFAFRVNTDPVPGAHAPLYVMKGATLSISTVAILSEDSDPDPGESSTLAILSSSSTMNATAILSGAIITYTPLASFTGADVVSYQLSDANGATATGTIPVYVVTPTTWTGAVSSIWTNPANWCGTVSTDHFSCTGSGAIPSSTAVAIFDGTCSSANCSTTLPGGGATIGGLELNSGYNGTLRQANGTGNDITFNATVSQHSGTFTGAVSSLTFNSGLLVDGGVFNATNGLTTISSGLQLTSSAQFHHNSSSIKIVSENYPVVAVSSNSFYNLKFYAGCGSSVTFSGTASVSGTLIFDDQCRGYVNGGKILALGPLSSLHAGITGTVDLQISGNSTQTVQGDPSDPTFPPITINSSAGTVLFANIVQTTSLNYVQGVVDFSNSSIHIAYGDSWTMHPPPSVYPFQDLKIDSGCANLTLTDGLYVEGTTNLNSGCMGSMFGASIYAKGDVNITSNGFVGTTALRLVGSSDQLVTGSSTARSIPISVESTGGTVRFAGSLIVHGFNYVTGTIDATTASPSLTLSNFYGPTTYVPGPFAFNNLTITDGCGGTYSTAGTWKVNGTLKLGSGCPVSLGGGNIDAKSDVIIDQAGVTNSTTKLKMSGSTSSKIRSSATGTCSLGMGDLTVAKTSGATVQLECDTQLSASGQRLQVDAGQVLMASHALTIDSNVILGGNAIHTGAGILTVGSTVYGAGSYFGGTVFDP